MNLTLENIQRTVDQADRFMEANGADRQKRLGYRLLLEQLLLGYRDLYGEEISYRLVLKRTWKRVFLSLHVACESRNLLKEQASFIADKIQENFPRGLFWKYIRHQNIIFCTFQTPMKDFRSLRYIWQYMRNEKHTFRWAVFLRFLNMALSVLEPLLSAWIIVAYTEAEIRKIALLALLILGQGVLSSLINYGASRLLRATYASMLKRMQIEIPFSGRKVKTWVEYEVIQSMTDG